MGDKIVLTDVLKLLAFVVILIMPPWFAFISQFKRKINTPLVVFMTLVYMVVASIALVISPFTQQLIPFILVLITIYIIRTRRSESEVRYYLRSIKGKKKRLIGYALFFKFATVLLSIYFVYELSKYGVEIKEQEISSELMNSDWITTIVLSFIAAVIAPILEEFVFRHTFYRGFSKKIGPIFAAIVSSLMFTVLHFNIASSAAIFSVGLFNCYLYEKEGYRAAVLSHFIFNFTSLAMAIAVKLSGVDISQFGFIFR